MGREREVRTYDVTNGGKDQKWNLKFSTPYFLTIYRNFLNLGSSGQAAAISRRLWFNPVIHILLQHVAAYITDCIVRTLWLVFFKLCTESLLHLCYGFLNSYYFENSYFTFCVTKHGYLGPVGLCILDLLAFLVTSTSTEVLVIRTCTCTHTWELSTRTCH